MGQYFVAAKESYNEFNNGGASKKAKEEEAPVPEKRAFKPANSRVIISDKSEKAVRKMPASRPSSGKNTASKQMPGAKIDVRSSAPAMVAEMDNKRPILMRHVSQPTEPTRPTATSMLSDNRNYMGSFPDRNHNPSLSITHQLHNGQSKLEDLRSRPGQMAITSKSFEPK